MDKLEDLESDSKPGTSKRLARFIKQRKRLVKDMLKVGSISGVCSSR